MNIFWIGKAVHSKMEFLELFRRGGGGLKLWASQTVWRISKNHIWKNMDFFGQNSFQVIYNYFLRSNVPLNLFYI